MEILSDYIDSVRKSSDLLIKERYEEDFCRKSSTEMLFELDSPVILEENRNSRRISRTSV